MSTLHKAEIREAGRLNSFRYQSTPLTAIHLPGDRLIRGNLPVRPAGSDTTVVGLEPTREEVAAVENITCLEDLRTFGRYHSSAYEPPPSFFKPGSVKRDRLQARRRPFTPDSRRMASVVELENVAQAEEFFNEAMQKLEEMFNAGTTDYQRLAEEPEVAAAVPSTRSACGVVDFGDLVQA